MKPLQVRFPDADMAALKIAAADEGVSMNDLVVAAVRDKVSRRARISAMVSEAKSKHAATLAELAEVIDYLSVEEVLGIIAEEGFALADPGLLASAVIRPQLRVFGEDAYPTLRLKAAALMESLGRNHPLEDGNKRIALVVTDVFLALNGWSLDRGEGLELADFVVRVVTGAVPLADSATYLESHCTTS